MQMDGVEQAGALRILEAPAGASPIRPRPDSGAKDPGLLVLEGLVRDPSESYHAVANSGAPMISPPRYYFFRNTMWAPKIDVMSYAPFGPAGEQLFLTANVNNERLPWTAPKLHGGFISASVTSLDQRPVKDFLEKALGLKITAQMECYQRNVNDLIGAPEDSYFLWSFVGTGVNMEVWEFKAESGTLYPCALDKTGLAMLTMRVNDLAKCRAMCAEAGIEPVGLGALPNLESDRPDGFTLRGAVGELYEIVQA